MIQNIKKFPYFLGVSLEAESSSRSRRFSGNDIPFCFVSLPQNFFKICVFRCASFSTADLATIIQYIFKNPLLFWFSISPIYFHIALHNRDYGLYNAYDKLPTLFYINSKLFFAEWSSKFREKNKQEQKQSRRKSFSVNINTDIWWVVPTLL